MTKITRPASIVKQGDLVLYTTSLRVKDLLLPNFYNIERLDPDNQEQEGYQRLLNKSRARKLAEYIVAGLENRDAFLPTSIFMATEKDFPFNKTNNTICIDTEKIGPFSIVDGQHRVEGLKMAAERDERVLEFEIPVNIAVKLSHLHQMAHFLIVNTTQKSVEEGIAQRIRSNFSQVADTCDLPTLPPWIGRLVDKGDDAKGIQIIDYLNDKQPWKGRIIMANEESPKNNKSITQKSFITLLKKHYFVRNNFILSYEIATQCRILENYWKAITSIIEPEEDSVLFKYSGVQLFLMFSFHFFSIMKSKHNHFKVDKMQEELQNCFDEATGEAAGIGHTDFWKRGGKAGRLNSVAVARVCADMVRALHSFSGSGEEV